MCSRVRDDQTGEVLAEIDFRSTEMEVDYLIDTVPGLGFDPRSDEMVDQYSIRLTSWDGDRTATVGFCDHV